VGTAADQESHLLMRVVVLMLACFSRHGHSHAQMRGHSGVVSPLRETETGTLHEPPKSPCNFPAGELRIEVWKR
jgi:hypothetical protein